MTISIDDERLNVRAIEVTVTRDTLTVELEDGRVISVPLLWYPRLQHSTAKERSNYKIGHFGIHWPDLDEDLSIRGLLLGNKSGESAKSFSQWLSYYKHGKKVPVKTLPMPDWMKRASGRRTLRSTSKKAK